jgi:hypothetical protein
MTVSYPCGVSGPSSNPKDVRAQLVPLLRLAAEEATAKARRFRDQGDPFRAGVYEDLACMRSSFLAAREEGGS